MLATSHETRERERERERERVIPSSIAICENKISTTKCYQEPFVRFIEVEHFHCFDVSTVSLCGIKLENMDWRTIFELWHNMRSQRVLSSD
jgi:hypothetical protein